MYETVPMLNQDNGRIESVRTLRNNECVHYEARSQDIPVNLEWGNKHMPCGYVFEGASAETWERSGQGFWEEYLPTQPWIPTADSIAVYAGQVETQGLTIFSQKNGEQIYKRYMKEVYRKNENLRSDLTLFTINAAETGILENFKNLKGYMKGVKTKKPLRLMAKANSDFIQRKIRWAKRHASNKIAEYWIAYWHCWAHFISDAPAVFRAFTDAHSVLQACNANANLCETVRFGSLDDVPYEYITKDCPFGWGSIPSTCTKYRTSLFSEIIHCNLRIRRVPNTAYRSSHWLVQALSTLGLMPTWHTLWDLLPWSFVLDWFISRYQLFQWLGLDKIGRVELPLTLRLENICVSQRIGFESHVGTAVGCHSWLNPTGYKRKSSGVLYVRKIFNERQFERFMYSQPIVVKRLGLVPASIAIALLKTRK